MQQRHIVPQRGFREPGKHYWNFPQSTVPVRRERISRIN